MERCNCTPVQQLHLSKEVVIETGARVHWSGPMVTTVVLKGMYGHAVTSYGILYPFLGNVHCFTTIGHFLHHVVTMKFAYNVSLVCSTMHWQLILALEWKDPVRDYFDVLAATFKHPSFLELENNAQVRLFNWPRHHVLPGQE